MTYLDISDKKQIIPEIYKILQNVKFHGQLIDLFKNLFIAQKFTSD